MLLSIEVENLFQRRWKTEEVERNSYYPTLARAKTWRWCVKFTKWPWIWRKNCIFVLNKCWAFKFHFLSGLIIVQQDREFFEICFQNIKFHIKRSVSIKGRAKNKDILVGFADNTASQLFQTNSQIWNHSLMYWRAKLRSHTKIIHWTMNTYWNVL